MIHTTDNNIWLATIFKYKMPCNLNTICRRPGTFKCFNTFKNKILLKAQRLAYRYGVPHSRLRAIRCYNDHLSQLLHCIYQR